MNGAATDNQPRLGLVRNSGHPGFVPRSTSSIYLKAAWVPGLPHRYIIRHSFNEMKQSKYVCLLDKLCLREYFLGTYTRNAGNIENKFAALDKEKESNKFEIFKHVLGEIV